MLAETSLGFEGPSFNHESTRSRRLADVKRGAEYYKKLDHIAEAQWKTNVPQFPAVTRKLSSLPKITTSVLSEPDANLRRSNMANMTSTPRQSLSMMSSQGSTYTGYAPTTHSQASLPHNLSRIIYHRNSVMDSPLEPTLEVNEKEGRPNFNPWGTSHSPLDDKTKLTSEDMKPRELPFHYRDNKKITPKPIPRKSMPMSRVAAVERDRHQRTVTNFRSRNGTIRIIKPLDPLPEIEKFQKSYKPEVFDAENIEREKTFMMLERIDKILHPNKKSPRTNLGSSEEEIPGSSDSTKTITGEMKELSDLRDSMNIEASQRKIMRSPHQSPNLTPRMTESSFKTKREKTRSSKAEFSQRPRIRFNDDPFKLRAPKTFSDILQSLEISLEDPDAKCQSWIDSCLTMKDSDNASRFHE